jgi:hypothetical protein
MRSGICLGFAVCLLAGCARYEFDVLAPAEVSGAVTGKADRQIDRPPLHYKLRAVENRLVMRIYNPGDVTTTLRGDLSYVVDPEGQSHPLPTLSAAPQSHLKLILPPFRPRLEPRGPTIGFGVGTVVGSHPGYETGVAAEPVYLLMTDDSNNAMYWDWPGESEIRMLLVFERGGERLEHAFVIRRVKI